MAFRYSPKIVTDGLVLYLDSINTKSYVSGSTSWVDISKTLKTGTLVNNPSFSNNYITFSSSTSQYGTVPSLGDLPLWTVEVFVKFNSSYNNKVSMVVGGQYNLSNKLNFSIGTNNSPSNYNISVGFYDGSWHNTTGINYSTNTWFHIVGTYDGATIKQYTNGNQVDSLNYVGTPSSGGEIRINRRWDDVVLSSNLFDTSIGLIRIYNRSLNSSEIIQNYNATKSRYGLT